ncbi:MAG: hypothetical protein KDA78_16045 [Planctomycetaceae bacterium]|nr:hypothetical protein [Planctomycetaceae bacterium]
MTPESKSGSTHETKRALFIAYQFPPVGGIGVHRVVKFTKFLREFGWETSVLTVSNPSVPLSDHSLEKDIPDSTRVIRAKTWEPGYAWKQRLGGNTPSGSSPLQQSWKSKLLSCGKQLIKAPLKLAANQFLQPDLQILWKHNALKVGSRLLASQPHDVVIATAPPFSSFLVGAELARHFQLPLVLDYRDEWGISNQYWENKQQNRSVQQRQRTMQAQLLRAADLAIATTPSSCQSVANAAREAGADVRCEYIYNGYDPADFPVTKHARVDYGYGTKRFRMVYAGTLWNLNTIEPLVTALEHLFRDSTSLMESFELVIAGRRTPEQEAILDRLGRIPCPLKRLGFLGHDEAVQLMQDADCLTLLNSPLPGAERIVNGKIFEYLATGNPFLLISPPGDMWQMMSECPLAIPCNPVEPEQISEKLALLLEQHRMGMRPDISNWDASRYERRHGAELLARHLDELTGRSQQVSLSGLHSQSTLDNPLTPPALSSMESTH